MNRLISAGKEKLHEMEDGREKEALAISIDDIDRRWSELQTKVTMRSECIQRLLPLSRDYSEAVERLLPWMSTVDIEARSLYPLSCEIETLIQQKRVVEVCK